MNRWRIPVWLEQEVIARDLRCVYCGLCFADTAGKRGDRPSWEHIINDARIITRENIARCCMSCNASKGNKNLTDWMASQYCVARGITFASVAPVIRDALLQGTRAAVGGNQQASPDDTATSR